MRRNKIATRLRNEPNIYCPTINLVFFVICLLLQIFDSGWLRATTNIRLTRTQPTDTDSLDKCNFYYSFIGRKYFSFRCIATHGSLHTFWCSPTCQFGWTERWWFVVVLSPKCFQVHWTTSTNGTLAHTNAQFDIFLLSHDEKRKTKLECCLLQPNMIRSHHRRCARRYRVVIIPIHSQ